MTTLLLILIPIAMLATLAILIRGVMTMGKEGAEMRRKSNKMMQLRIAAQALCILLLGLLFAVSR